MSRLLRALGLGGGGGERAAAPAGGARGDSPKVRRLRETMRWRGYDLSAYSDEQIAAVSARFPGDISEDGETTEDGRRALAEALARGDFAAPPSPPPASADAPASTRAPDAASPRARAEAPSASRRAGTGTPTFTERLLHVFGIHSWRRLEGDDGVSLRCAGCGRLRSAPAPFEPPVAPPPPPEEEAPPVFRQVEPPPDPVERDPDPSPFDVPRRQAEERPGQRPQQPESPWQFFLGLPWWTKLIAIFIFMQVIIAIVQRIA